MRGQQSPRLSSASYHRLGARLLPCSARLETRLVWMGRVKPLGSIIRAAALTTLGVRSFSATRPDNATVDIPLAGSGSAPVKTTFQPTRCWRHVHGEHRYGDDATVHSSSLDGFTAHQSRSLRLIKARSSARSEIPSRPAVAAALAVVGIGRAGIAEHVVLAPNMVGESPVPPAPSATGYKPVVSTTVGDRMNSCEHVGVPGPCRLVCRSYGDCATMAERH